MKIRLALTVLGLPLCVGIAAAQGNTRKTGSPDRPVPAVPPFAPVHWDPALPSQAYAENDPLKVYAWVEQKLAATRGKLDEFSTREERERNDAQFAAVMQAIAPIAFVRPCGKQYNADLQMFEITVYASAIDDGLLKEPNPARLNLRKYRLGGSDTRTRSYAGQNAYGAVSKVYESVRDEYVLAYPAGAGNEPNGPIVSSTLNNKPLPYAYSSISYLAHLPMTPDEARATQQDIACLAVLSLQPPYVFKYAERRLPTRTSPFDETTNGFALYGKLDRVQVINKATGQVYIDRVRTGL